MRELVIGDVHGAWRALDQALGRANYDPTADRLIFVGDYVDGWGQSLEVLRFIAALEDSILLLGNHDEWFLNWLLSQPAHSNWLTQGGKATVMSVMGMNASEYEDWWISGRRLPPNTVIEEFGPLMQSMLYGYHDEDRDYVFVHAGFNTHLGLLGSSNDTLLWDRGMIKDALDSWTNATLFGGNPEEPIYGHKAVFLGHTSMSAFEKHMTKTLGEPYDYRVRNMRGVWNMDTGAGWSGVLSVMDIDTKEQWQSDFVQTLYPEEKGR